MVSAGASANATDDNDNDHRFNVPLNHTHESSAGQMNMRGVFLHLLADALGSVIVIVSALVCIGYYITFRLFIYFILGYFIA